MALGKEQILLVALSVAACATAADSRPVGSIEGVWSYTAFEGSRSFKGTLSIGRTDAGYGGFLAFGGSDLPLARLEREGSRITLAFETGEKRVVLYLTHEARELKGRWRSLRRAGAIEAVRASTAWDAGSGESRRRGSN